MKEIKPLQKNQENKQPSNLEAEQALLGSILVNNDIIDEISNFSSSIKMLIFEFHWLDKNEEIFLRSIKKLQKDFDVVHIHGNNHCEKLSTGLPITLEMTLVNKNIKSNEATYVKDFPIKNLDFPNNPYKKDLSFSFAD